MVDRHEPTRGPSRRARLASPPAREADWAAVMADVPPPPPLVYRPPATPTLPVIFADSHLVALDKPAALLTVPGKPEGHDDCLETRVRAVFRDARIVHRLDRATSGVVVMPRTHEAHREIGLQFERRRTLKTYVARVAGTVSGDSGEVNAPLCGDWPRRPLQMVHKTHGKPALTRWRVLAREPGATLLALEPTTGRTHQLRVHMVWMGHPILGDEFYAPRAAREAADRLQLHAETLTIRTPHRPDALTLTARRPF